MENYSEISMSLRKDAVEAVLNFEIWWAYGNPDNPPFYSEVMDRYSTFFTTSKNAHFVASILPLYRIFEPRSDTVNLPELLKKLRKEDVLPISRLDEFDKKFLAIKPLWVKIAILRSGVFGHRSSKLSVEESFQKAGISTNDIFGFIDQALILVNEVDSELNPDSYQAFRANAGEEVKQILNMLGQNH